jgi:hypothetical protein
MSAAGIKNGEFQMFSSLIATVDQNLIKEKGDLLDNFGKCKYTNISKKILETVRSVKKKSKRIQWEC